MLNFNFRGLISVFNYSRYQGILIPLYLQDHYGRQVIPAPDGVPTLAGVVSWGVGCGSTSPGAGVYSDIRCVM